MPNLLKYGNDYDVDQWLAQMTGGTSGRPSESFINSLNNFVGSLKIRGIWNELDRLWVFATEQEQHAKVSLVNPTSTKITIGFQPTWTQYIGYSGDGSSAYLKTNYTASTDGFKYTQNNASYGVYLNSQITAGNKVVMGSTGIGGGTVQCNLFPRFTGDFYITRINITTASTSTIANTTTLGLFSSNRTNNNDVQNYKNGVNLVSNVRTSGGLSNTSFNILSSDGTTQYYNGNVAMAYIGSGNINQLNFYNAIESFAASIGFTNNYHPTLQTWYDALTVKPSIGLMRKLNILINGLATDGTLNELDLFHVTGGLETDEQRLKPIKTTGGANFTNTGATLSVSGITGDGVGTYVNSNWNDTLNGSKYVLLSSSLGVYIITDTNVGCDFGAFSSYVFSRNSGSLSSRLSCGNNISAAVTNSLGLSSVVRSSNILTTVYRNGVSLTTDATVTTGLNNASFTICNRTGGSNFSSRTIAMVFLGSGNINQTNLYNRVQTYMTSVGLNV